ncbi:MAG: hypothetical protein PUD59_04905 [bacterium]|nr:hypothetical protein [bacterium]
MDDVRLIDANALRKNLSSRYMNELYPDWITLPELTKMRIEMLAKEFRFAIDHAITIDAVPVVHARWVHDINNLYGCSACLGRETMSHRKLKKYCPNCGAKMDGGAEG